MPNFKEYLRDQIIQVDHAAPTDPLRKPKPRLNLAVTHKPTNLGTAQLYAVNPTWTESIGGVLMAGSYTLVVGALGHLEPKAPPDPLPDLILNASPPAWLYVGGIRPVVATRAVIAHAPATAFAIQIYTMDGINIYHRVYYVEGDPDKYVWVNARQGDAKPAVLTVGTYVEAKVKTVGTNLQFDSWKQPPHASTGRPIPVVAETTDYDALLAAVRNVIDQSAFFTT